MARPRRIPASTVRVKAQVELEREVDVTSVLDGWDLSDVREFVDDPDPEGQVILMDEGSTLKERRSIRIPQADLDAYVEHRQTINARTARSRS